jgi:hypothetical protein
VGGQALGHTHGKSCRIGRRFDQQHKGNEHACKGLGRPLHRV